MLTEATSSDWDLITSGQVSPSKIRTVFTRRIRTELTQIEGTVMDLSPPPLLHSSDAAQIPGIVYTLLHV